MDAFDPTASTRDADARIAPNREPGPAALWAALAADRRARDDRTARLRVMRLIGGDDGEAGSLVVGDRV